MEDRLFERATKARVAETAGEWEFEDMEDSFSLVGDEAENEALWAGLEARGKKPKRVIRGPALHDPLRREAYLSAKKEYYQRFKEQTGGSRSLCIGAGPGRMPTYRGRAAYFHIHPTLMSVHRLVWLTRLASHGTASAPPLGRIVGTRPQNTLKELLGMRGSGLVSSRLELSRGSRPGRRATLWEITENGRRWLWRAAWVSKRALLMNGPGYPLRNDVNRDPVRALRRHGVTAFLRPSALALAYELRCMGPCHATHLARFTGLDVLHIHHMLTSWRSAGWAEISGMAPARRPFSNERRLFRFTPAGETALARHVDALRRAAGASGHAPTPADLEFPNLDEDEG